MHSSSNNQHSKLDLNVRFLPFHQLRSAAARESSPEGCLTASFFHSLLLDPPGLEEGGQRQGRARRFSLDGHCSERMQCSLILHLPWRDSIYTSTNPSRRVSAPAQNLSSFLSLWSLDVHLWSHSAELEPLTGLELTPNWFSLSHGLDPVHGKHSPIVAPAKLEKIDLSQLATISPLLSASGQPISHLLDFSGWN